MRRYTLGVDPPSTLSVWRTQPLIDIHFPQEAAQESDPDTPCRCPPRYLLYNTSSSCSFYWSTSPHPPIRAVVFDVPNADTTSTPHTIRVSSTPETLPTTRRSTAKPPYQNRHLTFHDRQSDWTCTRDAVFADFADMLTLPQEVVRTISSYCYVTLRVGDHLYHTRVFGNAMAVIVRVVAIPLDGDVRTLPLFTLNDYHGGTYDYWNAEHGDTPTIKRSAVMHVHTNQAVPPTLERLRDPTNHWLSQFHAVDPIEVNYTTDDGDTVIPTKPHVVAFQAMARRIRRDPMLREFVNDFGGPTPVVYS